MTVPSSSQASTLCALFHQNCVRDRDTQRYGESFFARQHNFALVIIISCFCLFLFPVSGDDVNDLFSIQKSYCYRKCKILHQQSSTFKQRGPTYLPIKQAEYKQQLFSYSVEMQNDHQQSFFALGGKIGQGTDTIALAFDDFERQRTEKEVWRTKYLLTLVRCGTDRQSML